MKATLFLRHIILFLLFITCGAAEAQAGTDDAYDEVAFPLGNYSAPKGRFMGTARVDANTVVMAKINLAKCATKVNENILSIGQDIAHWGGNGSKNIHIYYKAEDRALQVNLVDNALSHTGVNGVKANVNWVRTTIALKSNILLLKLSRNGLYVNGVQVTDVRDNPVGKESTAFSFDECLAACGYFSGITSLQIGSREGLVGSSATYGITTDGTEPRLTSVTLPVMDYTPGGKPFAASCGDFCDDCKITAVIDLTTCRDSDENILSIGDDISEWKTQNGNLHFYYNRTTGKLRVAYAKAGEFDGGVGYGTAKSLGRPISLGAARKLTIELSRGSFVLRRDDEVRGVQCKALLKRMSSFWLSPMMEVGSEEGGHERGRTWATYGLVDIENNDGKSAHAVFPSTLPWSDAIADGRSQFCAKVPKVDFDMQSIYALLDISRCSSGENVLSVGTNIGDVTARCRIDFYVSPSSISRFVVDLWMNGRKLSSFLTDKLEDRGNATVRITKAGVFVDGKHIVNVSEALDAANGLEPLEDNIEVGSMAGNSKAVYKSVRLDSTVIRDDMFANLDAFTGYDPRGTRLFMADSVDVDFAKSNLEAKLDLSGCGSDNFDSGILSVGTAIKSWGERKQYNLHLYYNPSTMTVIADLTNGGTGNEFLARQKMVLPRPSLAVRLTADGLYLNERLCTKLSDKLASFSGLMSKRALQVGCVQGRPSRARYEYVRLSDNAPDGDFGRLPWTEVRARKNTFLTTEKINFAHQCIEAHIDVADCESYADGEKQGECYDESILSVGSRISPCDSCSFACLNVYYCKTHHRLVFELTDGDTISTGASNTVLYGLPEGKTDFVLQVASDGVRVDGTLVGHGLMSQLDGITRLGYVQVGSMQPEHRSTALYRSVRIVKR